MYGAQHKMNTANYNVHMLMNVIFINLLFKFLIVSRRKVSAKKSLLLRRLCCGQ